MPDAAPAVSVTFATADALPAALGSDDRPLVVMPFIDAVAARRSAIQLARRAGVSAQILCVHDAGRSGFIAVANAAFRRSCAPCFAYVAQDAFAGRHWLAHAVAALARDDGGLLAFNDGKWAGQLAAFGLVARGWAQGCYGGDLFHPEYRRHYADVELTVLAMQQRRLRFDPQALLMEVDWDKETQGVTAEDRALYHRRAAAGFDGKVADEGLRGLFS